MTSVTLLRRGTGITVDVVSSCQWRLLKALWRNRDTGQPEAIPVSGDADDRIQESRIGIDGCGNFAVTCNNRFV